MPSKMFKINVYDVIVEHEGNEPETTFENAITEARGKSLADREKNVRGKRRRLDDCLERNGHFLLNLINFEYAGSGRVRRGQPSQNIPLRADESFAPETAMLYDPLTHLAFVEASSGGTTAGAIAGYFGEFAIAGTDYSLLPRVDNSAAARARRHRIIRKLTMRVALGPITTDDRAAGIGPIKSFGRDYGAGTMDVELNSERPRDRSLLLATASDLISRFTGGDRGIPQIQKLRVTGKEHDDDVLEVIDLVQHREKRQLTLEIDSTSRKIPIQTRWDALASARRNFQI